MTRYPQGWREFSSLIRYGRAGGRCECTGECGLHQPLEFRRSSPGILQGGGPLERRCVEHDGELARYMKRGTLVMLTVAHLNHRGGPCRCDPLCAREEHVKAMCQRCHLLLDGPRHRSNARETRRRKAGQGSLFT